MHIVGQSGKHAGIRTYSLAHTNIHTQRHTHTYAYIYIDTDTHRMVSGLVQERLVVAGIVDQRTHHVLRKQLRHVLTAKSVRCASTKGSWLFSTERHGIPITHEIRPASTPKLFPGCSARLEMMVKHSPPGFCYISDLGQLKDISN